MPSTALKIVRPTRTRVVFHSPTATWLTIAAPSSRICMKSLYWRRKFCQPGSFFLPASSFRPYFCRREAASVLLSPLAESTPSSFATCSEDRVYHFFELPVVSAIFVILPLKTSGGQPCRDSPVPRSHPASAAWGT